MQRRLVLTKARSVIRNPMDWERLPLQLMGCAIMLGFGGLGAALFILEEVLRNSML